MGYENYLDAEKKSLQRAVVGKALSGASDKFKSLREARVKNEREAFKFDLDRREQLAKVKEMENNPMIDPMIVKQKAALVKSTLAAKQAAIDRNTGYIDVDMRPLAQNILQLGHVYNRLSQEELAQQNAMNGYEPKVSEWDKMAMEAKIDKEGNVNLPASVRGRAAAANSRSTDSLKLKALELAKDEFGDFNEQKYKKALKMLGVPGGDSQPMNDGDGADSENPSDDYEEGQVYNVKGKQYKYLGNDEFEEVA